MDEIKQTVTHDDALRALTVRIATAFVSANQLPTESLPSLIKAIYDALQGLTAPPAPEEVQPFVSVRKSVTAEALVCLVCGARQKMLKRHVRTAHQMQPQDYRAKFGLPHDYPMIAPEYSERRAALAKSFGLGQRGGRKRKASPTVTKARGGKSKRANAA
jgi:predicted transcriptional regulator